MARYTVVLDACVLVPTTLADALLRTAKRNPYRPLWSVRSLEEAMEAILGLHPGLSGDPVERRFAALRETFEDARVEDGESVNVNLARPDRDDLHVVAAALQGRAGAIVTANLRDFLVKDLKSLDLEVIHPGDFLLDQLDLDPRTVIDVIREQATHTRHPPLEPIGLLARLARCGVHGFADEVGRLI